MWMFLQKSSWWPAIHDAVTARAAAKQGMWAAFCCAGATAVLVMLDKQGIRIPLEGFGSGALLDAAIMAVAGVGILNMSRIAAVGGLLLYIAEQFANAGRLPNFLGLPIPMIIVVVVCFLNSIRGTFAFQRYKEIGG